MAEETDKRNVLADGFWVDDWFVEPMLNRMSRGDETVQVEPKVMEVLLCMAKRPGKTVSKDEFMEQVWTDTVVTDDVLSRCISELRKAFGDDSRDPDYIETIRKIGYRLIAPVSLPDENGNASPEADGTSSTRSEPSGIAETMLDQIPPAEKERTLHTLIRRLSSDLEGFGSGRPKSRWTAMASGTVTRRWLLTLAAIVLVLAMIGGLLFARYPASPPSNRPLSATPFTSFPGQEVDPALSPDGQQIVFSWDGGNQGHQNLYLMQEAAEEPLRLTKADADDRHPAWSPDGRFIAFVRQTDDAHSVYIISSIGGNEREIASFSSRKVQGLSWSPNASQRVLTLSLQQRPHQAYSLYRTSLRSDSLVQLTHPPRYSVGDTDPVFSPDGSEIAFTRTLVDRVQDVYVVPAKGGNARAVTSDSTMVSGLDWLPGGEQLVFASHRGGTSGLWRVPVKGNHEPEWITTASEGTTLRHPSLARQGSRLAYAQQASQVNVWKVSNPTDYSRFTTTRLLSSTQSDTDPSIAPSGDRIAFASRRSGHPEIWTARADGSAAAQLTSFEGPLTHSPRWSPDGNQIAFVSRRNGSSDIFVVRASGGPPQRLTTSLAEDLMPRWSHDGSAIYFASSRTGNWESWRISVQGDSAEQVTEGGGLTAQESPDGALLYFIRPDTTGLWAATLSDATLPISVTPAPAQKDSLPDLLAQNTAVPSNHGPGLRGPRLLRDLPDVVLQPDSVAAPEHIATGLLPSDHANWTVNDRGIYFLRRDTGSTVLSFYRFSTQRTNSLFLLQDVAPEGGLAASPTGEWFLHARKERYESDILLVEDFQP